MQAIVAADNNWGIGYQNRLLVSIPSDMKFFRQKTTGNVVVMGRKTLESFPNGLPLKNRVNIVLTKNKNYQVKDAVIVHSEEELLEELKKYPSEKIYVLGGESIYKMMLPYCDTVYVTKIDREFQADTYFPNLDQMEDWKDPAVTAATNAASSCSGLLIPPSNALITYSLASGGTSVAALFMAGYIPGINIGLKK